LVNAAKLQQESTSEADRKAQAYVDEPSIVAPSVITLNAVATAHAADDFLFYITGLRDPAAPHDYMRFSPNRGARGSMSLDMEQIASSAAIKAEPIGSG